LNVGSDGDYVTPGGKLFHVLPAATWNAQSPTVEMGAPLGRYTEVRPRSEAADA